jgi:hypothetical protein
MKRPDTVLTGEDRTFEANGITATLTLWHKAGDPPEWMRLSYTTSGGARVTAKVYGVGMQISVDGQVICFVEDTRKIEDPRLRIAVETLLIAYRIECGNETKRLAAAKTAALRRLGS